MCEAEELLRFISRDQHDRVTRREPRRDVSGGLFHVLGQPVELPVVIEESPERGQIPAPRLTYVNHGSRPLKIPSPDSTLYLQSAGDAGAGSRALPPSVAGTSKFVWARGARASHPVAHRARATQASGASLPRSGGT